MKFEKFLMNSAIAIGFFAGGIFLEKHFKKEKNIDGSLYITKDNQIYVELNKELYDIRKKNAVLFEVKKIK